MKRGIHLIRLILYLLLAVSIVGSLFVFLALGNPPDPAVAGLMLGMAVGGVVMMGVYSFTLCLFRPTEWELVIFGVFCFAAALRFLFTEGSMGGLLIPAAARYSRILFAMASSVMVVSKFNFICQLFDPHRYRRLRLGLSLAIPLYTAAVFLLGVVDTRPERLAALLLFVLETLFGTVIIIRSGQLQKHPVNRLYFAANLWFLVSFFLVSPRLPFMMIPTNYVLLLVHAVVLADRYAGAIEAVEQMNTTLELAVAERTAELQEAYVQVADSERHLKELVGNISHDLKTPLAVAGVNLEQLIDPERPKSTEESRRLATVAYHKNLDLQRLTRNLFEVVRMEGGGLSYTLTWAGLDDLMAEAYRRYVDYIEGEGVLPVILYHGRCQVLLDQEKIWNVFDNLINNALRYTPEGGSITLEAVWDGAEVVDLAFRDTGCGIGQEHLPHIFEQYYKAEQSRGGGGESGLGLYIVKSLAEGMGGSVRAESVPGEGTAVTVRLKARPCSDGTGTEDCHLPG